MLALRMWEFPLVVQLIHFTYILCCCSLGAVASYSVVISSIAYYFAEYFHLCCCHLLQILQSCMF